MEVNWSAIKKSKVTITGQGKAQNVQISSKGRNENSAIKLSQQTFLRFFSASHAGVFGDRFSLSRMWGEEKRVDQLRYKFSTTVLGSFK